jgi:hypothetical protein
MPPDVEASSWVGRSGRTTPTMITEMPLEYASDRRHRKSNERPLVGSTSAGLDQPRACHLEQVLLILAAMQEPACQRLSQPQVGSGHLVEDLLTARKARRVGFEASRACVRRYSREVC